MSHNQAQQDFWQRINALIQNTNLEEKDLVGTLDAAQKRAVAEVQRNTRHAAVDKVNAIVERWNQKHPMDENVESLLNEITGALFNLRQP